MKTAPHTIRLVKSPAIDYCRKHNAIVVHTWYCAEVEGARAAAVYDRNACWAPSLICAGLGGCYKRRADDGGPRRKAYTLSPG